MINCFVKKIACFLKIHNWKSYKGYEEKCSRCGCFRIHCFYTDTVSPTYLNSMEDEKELEKSHNKWREEREESQRQFERIVGDDPFKQIDWICKHGLKSFNEWLSRCEEGLKACDNPINVEKENKSIHKKRMENLLQRAEEHLQRTEEHLQRSAEAIEVIEECFAVRGGRGNRVLSSWTVEKKIVNPAETFGDITREVEKGNLIVFPKKDAV